MKLEDFMDSLNLKIYSLLSQDEFGETPLDEIIQRIKDIKGFIIENEKDIEKIQHFIEIRMKISLMEAITKIALDTHKK